MKLQKAARFGLYAVLELARDPEQHLSAGDIAGKYGISTNHLAKVLRTLSRAGLVESVRGAGGGYRFTGNARRVTLLQVIMLFEDIGPGAPRRVEPGERTEIGRALSAALGEIDDIAQATLRSITISTLFTVMARQRRAAGAARSSEASAAD